MPRAKSLSMQTEMGPHTVSKDITVKDNGSVVGRARVEVLTTGKVYVHLQQTYGGAREGTLDTPVRCDLDVLQAICAEAETLADGG